MTHEERIKEINYHKAFEQGLKNGISKCIELSYEYAGCSADDLIKALLQLEREELG